MLVGINRHAPREKNGFSPAEYQCQVIQYGDILIQNNARSTLEIVLETLRSFKQEFVFHQKLLASFDITKSAVLCPDVLVQIAEYLSLSDAINAFSMGVLSLLRDGYSKVHLNNPSKRFAEMIHEHLDPRQVASLHINDDPQRPRSDLSALCIFDQLISLTVSSIRDSLMIFHCLDYLPNIRRLSLWFDDPLKYSSFNELTNLSNYAITRLHIHCAGKFFDHNWIHGHPRHLVKNTTVTSLIIDLDYYPLRRTSQFTFMDVLIFINSVLGFLESLVNIRRVRLIIIRDHLEAILCALRWQQVISKCVHLNRVIVQLKDHGDFKQEATNMEQELRQFRPEMIFRIKTAW